MTGIPLGGVVFWPSDPGQIPGLSLCDGSEVEPGSTLGAFLGLRFGQGPSGSPTLPDLLGRFVRGAGRADVPGTQQTSAFQAHSHGYDMFPSDTSSAMVAEDSNSQWRGAQTTPTGSTTAQSASPSGLISQNETRPVNIYLHFMISPGESQ
jgi:hypothetical protein